MQSDCMSSSSFLCFPIITLLSFEILSRKTSFLFSETQKVGTLCVCDLSRLLFSQAKGLSKSDPPRACATAAPFDSLVGSGTHVSGWLWIGSSHGTVGVVCVPCRKLLFHYSRVSGRVQSASAVRALVFHLVYSTVQSNWNSCLVFIFLHFRKSYLFASVGFIQCTALECRLWVTPHFDFWQSPIKERATVVVVVFQWIFVLLWEFFTVGHTMFRVAITTRPGSLLQSSALLLLVVFMPLGSLLVTNGQRWRKKRTHNTQGKRRKRSKQLCHEISLRLVMPRIRSRSLGQIPRQDNNDFWAELRTQARRLK